MIGNHEEIMKAAAEMAEFTSTNNIGGPFGAAVTDKDGNVIAISSNTVLHNSDPTCHAEMNAIRLAAKHLGTHDLSGCSIYATGAPCPMCLSAILWANIDKLYISGLPEDAAAIGFRDDWMFDYLANNKVNSTDVLEVEEVDRSIAQSLYSSYAKDGVIY